MPPESPEALDDVVHDVAGAVFHLSVLAGALAGPAAQAPGWLGDDAAAAALQVGAVATLARQAADAVLAAMHRLSAHLDCLHEARRDVAALQREQQEDFAAAWVRLARIEAAQLAVMTAAPEWVGTVEELRASEASRRRRHGMVLERVTDDAAETARVLADASAAVGGRGGPGDADRVLAHVAARLPGWGDAELASRGLTFADLFRQPFDPARLDAQAREAAPLAGSQAFADGLLAGLGEEGMRDLLTQVGDGDFGSGSPLAALLVRAIGAAEPASRAHEPVGDVLEAAYVDAADPGHDSDRIVLGMAVLLAAAATGRSGTLPPSVIGRWGRQIIGREHAQGASAVDRLNVLGPHEPPDPVPLVVDLLGRPGATDEAAALLTQQDVWKVLLAREWPDGCAGLARLVRGAGGDTGSAGGTALRSGLEVVGAGLAHGDPREGAVLRTTAAALALPLAEGLAAHPFVAVGALEVVVDGATEDGNGDMLRGLAFMTTDRTAAVLVEGVLREWAWHEPGALAGTLPASHPVVAVPAAYVALQEYGQRLAHTLDAFEAKAAAEDRQWRWNGEIGLLSNFVGGRLNPLVVAAEPFLAQAFDADGSWEAGPDRGLVFDRHDAARSTGGVTLLADEAAVAALERGARAAFDGTVDALGMPEPPKAPKPHPFDPFIDAGGALGTTWLDDLARLRRRHP
jgi:hypothetical protein